MNNDQTNASNQNPIIQLSLHSVDDNSVPVGEEHLLDVEWAVPCGSRLAKDNSNIRQSNDEIGASFAAQPSQHHFEQQEQGRYATGNCETISNSSRSYYCDDDGTVILNISSMVNMDGLQSRNGSEDNINDFDSVNMNDDEVTTTTRIVLIPRLSQAESDLQKKLIMEQSSSLSVITTDQMKKQQQQRRRRRQEWWRKEGPSIIFAARITMTILISLLVVLLPLMLSSSSSSSSSSFEWPLAEWILISAAIVSWQATLDRASVLKKTLERIGGTILGACMGLLVGSLNWILAYLVPMTKRQEVLILTASMLSTIGAYSFLASRHGYLSSYPATLGNLTFCLVVLAFFPTSMNSNSDNSKNGEENDLWMFGVFRVVNILLGCIIAGIVSLSLWPTSTMTMLDTKVMQLLKQTGQSVKSVLDSSIDISDGWGRLPSIYELVYDEDAKEDEAHQAYLKNMELWKECRQLFGMLKYDPWFHLLTAQEKREWVGHWKLQKGRAFRMASTVVILDSLIRSGLHRGRFADPTAVLARIGQRIRFLLDVSSSSSMQERDTVVHQLLWEDLVLVQQHLAELATTQRNALQSWTVPADDMVKVLTRRDTLPLKALESPGQSAFFYRLVEHLIFRSIRVYHYDKEFRSQSKNRVKS